jgi:hypothetical protein
VHLHLNSTSFSSLYRLIAIRRDSGQSMAETCLLFQFCPDRDSCPWLIFCAKRQSTWVSQGTIVFNCVRASIRQDTYLNSGISVKQTATTGLGTTHGDDRTVTGMCNQEQNLTRQPHPQGSEKQGLPDMAINDAGTWQMIATRELRHSQAQYGDLLKENGHGP